MDKFIVSARKYRPETFRSVVGQESITGTLKNAIRNDHLGHAYLFCGPRGVGKTTCARIFAKTINCKNPIDGVEPCNECESCKAFNETRSYNIHELDAASNNSVDDIRTLTEQVRIPPQIGKFSVYIIDEVHMLSSSAFNAFLKTLEEPPAHAVFILATTEKHKIIPTILSRCQIFDFNRIRVNDAVTYLEYIAQKENINYEKEALHIIAQKADGAMRDALSIFDQVVSFSGNDIRYQTVIDNLNILDFDYYFSMTDAFLEGNVSKALLIFDQILDKGFDAHNFLNGLASHLRDLLVSKDQATVKLLEVSDSLRERYLNQAARCSSDFIYQALEVCNQADISYKSSRNQRLLLELSLVKLSRITALKKKPLAEESDAGREPEKVEKPVEQASSEPDVHPPEIAREDKQDKSETQRISHTGRPSADSSRPTKPAGPGEETTTKNLVRSTGISIKSALGPVKEDAKQDSESDDEEADEPELETEITDSDFETGELLKKWNEFADTIREEKPRLAITLKSREPELMSDFRIRVSMDNASQLEDFNLNVKQDLHRFLRQELNNSLIQIIPVLNEPENVEKRIYTDEDKFQHMNGKNPNLEKLKQQFNLDFE